MEITIFNYLKMENKNIVYTRKEFNELLRKEFIPYLIEEGLQSHIDFFNHCGMFHKWTSFFYW